MDSIKTLENMDTDGKRHQRLAVANVINEHFPNGSDGFLASLSGLFTDENGKLIEGSEMWWFLTLNHWNPAHIIAVDKDPVVVKRNKTNKDPRCKGILNICGDFREVIAEHAKTKSFSVVNFDHCGDAHKHGWEVTSMMLHLNTFHDGEKTLFLTNWNIKGRATGGSYDAYNVLRNQDLNGYSFHQVKNGICENDEYNTPSTWKHIGAQLNGKKDVDFKYIGGYNSPMQSVWFIREGKVFLPTRHHGKSPKELTAIAYKAWSTRRKNGNA